MTLDQAIDRLKEIHAREDAEGRRMSAHPGKGALGSHLYFALGGRVTAFEFAIALLEKVDKT